MPAFHALLLTDVVDSTKLTEELGDAAMAQLWIAHDRVARDLLPLWRGREIDKTDGMLLLFDDVRDAVGYALAYHHALAARGLPFKARAGIHVGPVGLRPNPPDDVARGAKPVEVDGLALPIAARVMSVALGAQTLLSADARLALGVTAQRVVSHGHWHMHGVADPVELFEVGDIGEGSAAPFTAPPDAAKVYRVMRQGDLWQPVREVRHSVPAERDSFVGRQEPLALLAKKFKGGARLVSVLGIGGTGKTRLVTRFAWTWLGDYPGGVWFCDLSQARTVDGIHFAVAKGLDVPLGKTDPVVQLAHAIAGRGRCLVVLDNFEQVARFAEETLGRWLDRAPMALFLVTTREVLGIVGEEMLALAPLPQRDAVALFIQRAQAANSVYSTNATDDRNAIDHLVEVLDGLPLAIELAAARAPVMAPRALLARMNERFKLLRSASGRGDRQSTLRAAFDWSWELLTEPEKIALAQLSVFEGGFTFESAEAVLDLSPSADGWAIDVVHWLVAKSFVRKVTDNRFDLLESVREYAAEHLRTPERFMGSGEAAVVAARTRHWRYFAGLDERAAVANHCIDANNLVAACRRATAHRDADAAVSALIGAWAALKLTGPFRVAADLARQVQDLPDLTARHRATAAWVAGHAHDMVGEVAEAHRHFDVGLAWVEECDDRRQEARLYLAIGVQHANEGRMVEAERCQTRALDLARAEGDLSRQCLALNELGRLADYLGQSDKAYEKYQAALLLARATNDVRQEGGLLGNIGALLLGQGRLNEARQLFEQALALAAQVGDRRWAGNTHCNLGLLHHEQGRDDEARRELEIALRIAGEIGHPRLKSTVLCNLGIVLEAQGDNESARRKYEEALAGAQELSDRRSEGQFNGYLGAVLASLGHFAEAQRRFGAGEALLIDVSDRLSLALLLCQRAQAHQRAEEADEARSAIERAEQLAVETNAGADSELGRMLAGLRVA